MRPSVGARSDVGRVRDGNEDSYLIQDPFYVVADGMGGHLAGDVASRIAVQTISEKIEAGSANTPSGLEDAVKAANGTIWQQAQQDASLHGMGTTCTLIFVTESEIHLAHVGDSRAYLLRDGELSQLTEDHTLVGRMVKEGRLQPEEAERHPQRNIVTRALGVDDNVDVDLTSIDVRKGDTVLICSDGLTSMIDARAIKDVLLREKDPQRAADALVDLANEAGGEDNITTVVLTFNGNGVQAHQAATLTQEVASADVARRRETTQPGATAEEVTGAFTIPKDEPAPAREEPSRPKARRGRPVLTTLLLVVLLLAAAAAAFKYLVVDNSYYVGPTPDGRVAIYQGLPEDVLGMTFQDQVEVSEFQLDELPEFLIEDVEDAIEADSLSDARSTLANLEERAQDEEFQRSNDRDKGKNQ